MSNNRMWYMSVWLVAILFLCSALTDTDNLRLVLILAAATVGCVFIVCESRVQRAHAPLILRDESVAEKTKPPEGGNG